MQKCIVYKISIQAILSRQVSLTSAKDYYDYGKAHFQKESVVKTDENPEVMSGISLDLKERHLSQCMRFPTMWYVRPAKPQISLCICAV